MMSHAIALPAKRVTASRAAVKRNAVFMAYCRSRARQRAGGKASRHWVPAFAGTTATFSRPRGGEGPASFQRAKTLDPRLRGDDAVALRPRCPRPGLMRHFFAG